MSVSEGIDCVLINIDWLLCGFGIRNCLLNFRLLRVYDMEVCRWVVIVVVMWLEVVWKSWVILLGIEFFWMWLVCCVCGIYGVFVVVVVRWWWWVLGVLWMRVRMGMRFGNWVDEGEDEVWEFGGWGWGWGWVLGVLWMWMCMSFVEEGCLCLLGFCFYLLVWVLFWFEWRLISYGWI